MAIRLTEKEFETEVRRLICVEFMKRHISSIPSSQKDIDNFNENYEKISLNESLCIYDKLQGDIDKIFDAIMTEYEAQKDKIGPISGTCDFRGYPKYVNGIELKVKSPINCLDYIDTTVYDFENINDYKYNVSNRIFNSSYDSTNNKIIFDIGLFRGKLYKESFMTILSHELRHFYDIKVNKLYGKKFSKRIYMTSNAVMGLYNSKEPDINYNIAAILYLTDKSEILANCQKLGYEIEKKHIMNFTDLRKRSEAYSTLETVEDMFMCLKCYPNDVLKGEYDIEHFNNIEYTSLLNFISTKLSYLRMKYDRTAAVAIDKNNGKPNFENITENNLLNFDFRKLFR